jgi:hypothetical protein
MNISKANDCHQPDFRKNVFLLLSKNNSMSERNILTVIKLIHTVIWLFFNVVIFYLYYAAITNKIDFRILICIGLILLEGLVLLVFKLFCPITIIARKYSNSNKDNFDIFLPNWLARYNKLIYTSLFIIVLIILGFRVFAMEML